MRRGRSAELARLAAIGSWLLCACSANVVRCGPGGTFLTVEGVPYCAYEAPMDGSTVSCPPELPHAVELGDRVVCSRDAESASDLPAEVCIALMRSGCMGVEGMDAGGPDAGPDGGRDAGRDGGRDAGGADGGRDAGGADGGRDAEADAGADGGTACPLSPRATTVGLWCFEEGSGSTAANRSGSAPAIAGADTATWVPGGGVRLDSSSRLRIPDHASLDLGDTWTIETAVELDSMEFGAAGAAVLVYRMDCRPADPHNWARLHVQEDGRVHCEAGHQGVALLTSSSAPGAVAAGAEHIIACARERDVLRVLVDGADVTATATGSSPSITPGEDLDVTIGWVGDHALSCFPTPLGPPPGVLRAVAIHAEGPPCPLSPRATTVGLWCFAEGSGDTSASLVAGAPDVAGISTADWAPGGGIRPRLGSTVRIADDVRFDLTSEWTVEAVIELDELVYAPILARATYDSCTPAQWIRFFVQADGGLRCDVGENRSPATERGAEANGVLTTGTPIRVGCRRHASGEVSVLVEGADVTDFREGVVTTAAYGTDEPFSVGNYQGSMAASCFGAASTYLHGTLRALAIHDDRSAPSCTRLLADDFERPDGDLHGTSLVAPAGATWSRGSPSNRMDIVGGRIVGIDDGPYASSYSAPQGATFPYAHLRLRLGFRLPSFSHRSVILYANGGTSSTGPGGIRLYYNPTDRGGTLKLEEYSGGAWAPRGEDTGLNALLAVATDYFVEAQLDASGSAGTMRLSASGYADDGGTVLRTVPITGVAGTGTGSYSWVNNWPRDGAGSSLINEVEVHTCTP